MVMKTWVPKAQGNIAYLKTKDTDLMITNILHDFVICNIAHCDTAIGKH